MNQDLISLWTKTLNDFTILGPNKNLLIQEIKNVESLSPKLRRSIELAKIASTKKIIHKNNAVSHSVYEIYSKASSKTPSLYIVMGSVSAINFTIIKLIGIETKGKRFKLKTLVGD